MVSLENIKPVDYLVIGNITQDLTVKGPVLGGTASYSALTAKALGLRVGVVTSCAADLKLPELDGIQVFAHPADYTTTFENIFTPVGRIQYLHRTALRLNYGMVPECWRDTPVVHLGPIANEVDPDLAGAFPNSLVGLTVQGWLRGIDDQRRVHYKPWPEIHSTLQKANAVVMSVEDVENDESRIEEIQSSMPGVLVVTEGAEGARLYWNGDLRRFRPPEMKEVDPIGAGDIFASAFFFCLHKTQDPWEAASFATRLAAFSVTRPGLKGIPTPSEVESCLVEILPRV